MSEHKVIQKLLEEWADDTKKGRQDQILKSHATNVLIYDVLSPMKYEGTAAYRKSWDDWQPDTKGEGRFELQDLVVTSNAELAFAHAFIACGGEMENGKKFEDLVRATFCLSKSSGSWKIVHQHISKPIEMGG